ncbi:hypothetical protein [Sulfurimonas sp. C5]|uniref:hypothetical protein n=1 Tax=Sulfurimonas sp. C5 TaxID=3036947 RepID=UPI0024537D02|nr:hypothetical protein [Sulfurimonas sp. C5]MDH4943548.1 hypothetical protein [Sulfurimonas sp. C5]
MKTLQYAIITSLFVSTGLIAATVSTTSNSKASELSWVDEQVAAIKPARVGAKNSYLVSAKDPFIFIIKEDDKKKGAMPRSYRAPSKIKVSSTTKSAKDTEKKKGKLSLEAIINKSALIDGKWYKEGQNVYSYKLEKVDNKMVVLKRGQTTIVLSTKTKHKSLKFNNN